MLGFSLIDALLAAANGEFVIRIGFTVAEESSACSSPCNEFCGGAEPAFMKSLVAGLPSAGYIVRRHLRGLLRRGMAGSVTTMKRLYASLVSALSVTSRDKGAGANTGLVPQRGHEGGELGVRQRRKMFNPAHL
jgi:hypothetical protein